MKDLTIHVLNSIIAGLLVFFGSAATELTEHGFDEPRKLLLGLCLGFIAGMIFFLTKLQAVLETHEGTIKLFSFT